MPRGQAPTPSHLTAAALTTPRRLPPAAVSSTPPPDAWVTVEVGHRVPLYFLGGGGDGDDSGKNGPAPPPVALLLHGNGFHGLAMAPLAPALLAAGFFVVSLDFRGHGACGIGWRPGGAMPPPDTSHATLARDVATVIRARGWGGRCAILGHSLGGGVAALVSLACPGLASALFLYEPVLPAPATTGWGRAAAGDADPAWGSQALIDQALARPDAFSSLDAARASLASARGLRQLCPEAAAALADAYFWQGTGGREGGEHGTSPVFHPRCHPLVEAAVYAGGYPGAQGEPWGWGRPEDRGDAPAADRDENTHVFWRLAGVNEPVAVARGRVGDGPHASLAHAAAEIAAQCPKGELVEFLSLRHLGPLEDPTAVGAGAAAFFVRAGAGPRGGAGESRAGSPASRL